MHTFVIKSDDHSDLQADLRVHYEFVPGEDCLSPDGADVDFDRVQARRRDGEFGTATTDQVNWATQWVQLNKPVLIEHALADLATDAELREELLEEQRT